MLFRQYAELVHINGVHIFWAQHNHHSSVRPINMHTVAATVVLASLLACCLAAAVETPTKEQQQLIALATAQVAECSKEFGVPAETVQNFAASEATEKVQCFARCVARKLNYVTEKNEFNVDRVIAFNLAFGLAEPVIRRKLESCKSAYNGSDSCVSAWEAFRCYEKA